MYARWKLQLLALLALLPLARPAGTCGPSFPIAIFVRQSTPAVPYPRFVAGSLGVLQPTYPTRQLVIAYNILGGHPLSPADQAEAVQLQHTILNRDLDPNPSATSGLTAWIQLRQTISLPGSGIAPLYPNDPAPPTIDIERQVPGEDFQSFTNCLDDAFRTAASTLQARQAAHGPNSPDVLNWVHAQDDVFSNCAGARPHTYGPPQPPPPPELAPDRTPASTPANAPPWLQQDRAYQIAAAHFYRTDFNTAAAEFRAIAADSGSPWHQTARYLVARTLIRRATVGQISDVPPDTSSPPNYEAQQKREAALKQQLPTRLRDVQGILDAILKDPSMSAWHHSAQSLLDLLGARLDPAHQATILAARLTSTTPPASSTFQQNLIDLAYVLDALKDNPDAGAATQPPDPSALLAWIDAMQSVPEVDPYTPGLQPQTPPSASVASALATWQRTHSIPWLVAALTLAQPGGLGTPALIEAASHVPPSSPAYLSVTYHRLRLTPPSAATRSEIAALLPSLEHSTDLSAVNLCRALQSSSSPTLEAFLAQAPRTPAAVAEDGEEDVPTDPPGGTLPDQACGPRLVNPPLFALDTATILNQRLPLRLLAQAALSTTLPPNLRFQVAQSAWTRALLLNHPEIARSLAPVLIGCRDAWRPVLDAYAAAQTPDTREVASLFALMRFSSTEPRVRSGEQRPDGFATYSEYRDNWWCGNQPALGPGGKPLPPNDPHQRNLLFNEPVLPTNAVPEPPFLTPEDHSEAAVEIAELQKIPGAPDYFAQQTLNYLRAHPEDKNNAELLGQAERIVRNGCRSDNTRELNHQLFTAVQTRYPNSTWARKYTTWE